MLAKEDELTYRDVPKLIFHQLKCSFSVFGGLIPPFPYYLYFLNLEESSSKRLSKSMMKLANIFQRKSKEKIVKAIFQLLKSYDWRPQIVACVAIGKLEKKEQKKFITCLWKKLEKEGSWVSPQILAILSWIDLNFITNHKKHLSSKGLGYETFKKSDIDKFINFLNTEENLQKYGCSIDIDWRDRLKELCDEVSSF